MGDVTDFLEQAGVDFDVLEHTRTVRAADEAAALGIDAEEVAKTLILIAGSGNVRAVLPASERRGDTVASLVCMPTRVGARTRRRPHSRASGRACALVRNGR